MSENSSSTPEPSLVWYVAINGERRGPLDFDQVCHLAGSGEVNAHTLCWRKGMAGWYPAGGIPELAALPSRIREQADDAAPPLPATSAVRRTEGQSGMTRRVASPQNGKRIPMFGVSVPGSAAAGVVVGGLLGGILGAILTGLYYYDAISSMYGNYLLGKERHYSEAYVSSCTHYLGMLFGKVVALIVVAAVAGSVIGFFVKDRINRTKL